MRHILLSSLTMSSLLMGFVTFSAPASAGIHVEPFLGYIKGEDNDNPKDDVAGTEFGARLGYRTLGFSIGGELSMMNLKVDADPDIDFKPQNFGIFASYEFPILLRVYGTYLLASSGDYGSAIEMEDGSGYKLGVGFTGLPFIAINVEMGNLTYKKAKIFGFSGNLDPNYKINYYGINVSLPLAF